MDGQQVISEVEVMLRQVLGQITEQNAELLQKINSLYSELETTRFELSQLREEVRSR